jgi:hypothetical protein
LEVRNIEILHAAIGCFDPRTRLRAYRSAARFASRQNYHRQASKNTGGSGKTMPGPRGRGARSEEPEVRRFLSRGELARHWKAIERALGKKKRVWGLQGWSIQGRGDRLRVVAKVPFRRLTPRVPVAPLNVGGRTPFLLKVGVEASFFTASGKRTSGGRTGRSLDVSLAPGAPIEVSSGGRSRCGIGAVLDLDGEPFLLTCGHTFESAAGKVFLPRGGPAIARLTRNLLDAPEPLDAAICELLPRGRELLDESTDADTWFDEIHTPDSSDNGTDVAFWPTSEAEPDPIDVRVESFSACFDPLFGPGGPNCRFIETRFPASEGDSGSVLARGDRYYGICSGTAGSSAYFTAISDVVEALRDDFGRIRPWLPD